jgi:predicted CoA-substrate-specific enzyme activase
LPLDEFARVTPIDYSRIMENIYAGLGIPPSLICQKKYYLGVDCGSVAIKAVLLDQQNKIIKSSYYRNCGIIATLKQCLENILVDIHKEEIIGVGITGSGRFLVDAAIGSDLIESEILAHAIAAIHHTPNVQTVLDIGGEDSKLIKIRNEIACDFRMNHVCGGGTGAFIDSIANRLGTQTEDVGDLALKHQEELQLPGKCGVFAQSAVVSRLNSGASREDILWGVCKALVRNFLLLGRGIELKPPFIFQGAVAKNKAVSIAMAQELGHPITVPSYCQYTGAMGVALLTKEKNIEQTHFRGIDHLDDVCTRIIRGDGCPNNCEITQILSNKEVVGSYGSRCGKCG